MGHKKRQRLDIEDILARPWCYYCERDFEDLKLLISHQKAKHFKCDRCGRRLNTAGGLSVHMNQVHKETLTQVENALPNRQGLDVEIFGMEGIPVDILDQHRTRIVQNFYQAQEDRRIATGNVQPHGARGTGSNPPRKKIRIEAKEEIQARLKEYIARKRAEKEAGVTGDSGAKQEGQPEQQQQGQQQEFNPAYPQQAYADPQQQQQQQQAYAQHYTQAGIGGGAYPPAQQQAYPPSTQMPSSLPARPPIPPPGLPQRPGGTSWPAGAPAAPGDDIDQLIRMAEAGIKPPQSQAPPGTTAQGVSAAAAAADSAGAAADNKKAKRERARMIYSDPDEVSPEERMARLARYAFVEVGA